MFARFHWSVMRATDQRLTTNAVIVCVLTIYQLAVPTVAARPVEDSEYQIIYAEDTYQEATKTCGALTDSRWNLPSTYNGLTNKELHDRLVQVMEKNGLKETWIGLQRKDLHSWINHDNTTFAGEVQEDRNIQKTCGQLNLDYEALISDTCQSKSIGYLCQIRDCNRCLPSLSPTNCFQQGSRCYVTGCDVASSFNAANQCRLMGGELATIQTEYQLKKIIKWIKSSKPLCQHYWIGIRKTYWEFTDGMGSPRKPESYYWYSDHPDSAKGCAVLKKFPSGYYWESQACNSRHPVVCLRHREEKDQAPVTPATHFVTDNTADEQTQGNGLTHQECRQLVNTNTTLLILTLLLLILLFIMTTRSVTMRLLKRCRKQKDIGEDKEATQQCLQEVTISRKPNASDVDAETKSPCKSEENE